MTDDGKDAVEMTPPPPAATLVRLVREAAGLSVSTVADRAGISQSRWTQIENGYETRGGTRKPVKPKPGILAHMAAAVGNITPERLASEGQRPDAAQVLREILAWKADQDKYPAGQAPPPAEGTSKPPDADGFTRPVWLDWREGKARELEQEFRLLTHRDIFNLITTLEREMTERAAGLSHTREVEAEVRHLRSVNGS